VFIVGIRFQPESSSMSDKIRVGGVVFDLDAPVWGAAAIGVIINRTERQAQHLLETGRLPARKLSRRKWVATPRALLQAVIGDAALAAMVAANTS
jgi:hypothetical protein